MSDAADLLPQTEPGEDDVRQQLDDFVAGRGAVLDRIIVAARRSNIGALLLIGPLGRGGGDAWSDLDLIAVPAPGYRGLDLAEVFAGRVLTSFEVPRSAPIGGAHRGLCLDVAGMALWVDWFVWPQATAVVPADATTIYDDLGLAGSDQDFVPLINAHRDPAAPAYPADAATLLLRLAVGAKYLARTDLRRLIEELPAVQGLSLVEAGELLHSRLDGIGDPALARAIASTRHLIVLAAASARYATSPESHGSRETPQTEATVGLAYGTVAVVAYQPGWVQAAASEIALLHAVLAGHASGIEHIGSTAVPGLAAKPIIDIAVQLEPHADPAVVAALLTGYGLLDRGQKLDAGGHLLVAEPTPGVRTMHVHVLEAGDPQWPQYLQVRETLRDRPLLAAQYQQLKHDLAARHAGNRAAYTAAKAEFLTRLISDGPVRELP